jgi:hypothetical protein
MVHKSMTGQRSGPEEIGIDDPTLVKAAPVSVVAAGAGHELVAEFVLIQMDEDPGLTPEDVLEAFGTLALTRDPARPVRALPNSTLVMRTFTLKAWARRDGRRVLEVQDDQGQRCSLVGRQVATSDQIPDAKRP